MHRRLPPFRARAASVPAGGEIRDRPVGAKLPHPHSSRTELEMAGRAGRAVPSEAFRARSTSKLVREGSRLSASAVATSEGCSHHPGG